MGLDLIGRQGYGASLALLLLVLIGATGGHSQISGSRNSRSRGSEGVPSSATTLRTTRAIRSLSPTEAKRAYPVQLRAMVAFYDATINRDIGTLFVHDASGGIFVKIPARPVLPLHEGTVVEIAGVSNAGGFAPIVDLPQVRVLGESHMPREAPLVSLTQLMDGTYDSQWVQVEGVVHSVVPQGENMVMRIATSSGLISATTIRDPNADYMRLIDARVRVHAVAASRFNQRRQLAGVHLFLASLQDVRVLLYGPSDPFGLATRSVRQLSEFRTGKANADRAHLRGVVTLQRPGQLLCIQDATGGLCVDTLNKTQLPIGSTVDVVGFRAIEEASPKLTDAVFRRSSEALQFPASVSISGADALQGNYAGELVQLEGEIAGLNSDPREPAVLIASGGLIFSAVLPPGSALSENSSWQKGSKVRVLGICSAIANVQQADERQGNESYVGFRLLLRSPDDLTILKRPSWWTPLHAIMALSAVLVSTLGALGWAVFLHRRVRQQTGMLQESERRYRHLAYHDPLTGLPNRALLQQRLNAAVEQTYKSERCLALLMLDLDGFKQINDRLGHDAGDAVLRITAERVSDIVSEPDTLARIGGDEFVVVLLGLRGADEACVFAEKILQSLSAPLEIGADTASLSCSIGISVLSTKIGSVQALLKAADAAMYQAKMSGRNQYRLCNNDRWAEHSGRIGEVESGIVFA